MHDKRNAKEIDSERIREYTMEYTGHTCCNCGNLHAQGKEGIHRDPIGERRDLRITTLTGSAREPKGNALGKHRGMYGERRKGTTCVKKGKRMGGPSANVWGI